MNKTAICPIITANEIQQAVERIAGQIIADYRPVSGIPYFNPLIIGVLKGASRFMMDLVQILSSASGFDFDYDFIAVHSYNNSERIGVPTLTLDVNSMQVCDRHILIVDDIYDTGVTLNWLTQHFKSKDPLTIRKCVLLNKDTDKLRKIEIEYSGFDIPNTFVVGYGMDYDGKYRNLPYIGEIDYENS